MPEFPDVVRAPPERVWRALIEPDVRRRSPFIVHAGLESGHAGDANAVALYRSKRAAWRERILEAEPPRRLLVELRDPDTDQTRATMGWRIEPIQLGSLLVLEVQGKGLGEAATTFAWRRRWYRKLVEAVKVASESTQEPSPESTAPAPTPPVEEAPVDRPEPVRAPSKARAARKKSKKK